MFLMELRIETAGAQTCGAVSAGLLNDMDVCALLCSEHGGGKTCDACTDDDDVAVDGLSDRVIGDGLGCSHPSRLSIRRLLRRGFGGGGIGSRLGIARITR